MARADSPVVTVLTVSLLTALTWPVLYVAPTVGYDPSWAWALHVAAREHVRFGPQLAFTYGPLGFLGAPTVVTGPLYALDMVVAVALSVLVLSFVYLRLRRVVPWPLAFAGTYLVGRIPAFGDDRLTVLLLVLLVLGVTGGLPTRLTRVLPVVAGVVSGFALLFKFNSGVSCVWMALAYAVVVGRRDWRPPALAAGATVASFLGGWLVTGQRLGDIPVWFVRTFDVAAGYTAAMARFPDPDHQYVAAVLLTVVAGVAIAVATAPEHRLAVAVLVAPVGWVFFKHALVRFNDGGLRLGTLLLVLALPLAAGRRRWVAAGAGLSVFLAIQVVDRPTLREWANPGPRPAAFAREVRLVGSASARAELRAGASRFISQYYELTPEESSLLRGRTVHVDPYDTSALLPLGARWRPVPVFQTYSAYTPRLDDANAAALAGSDAPEYVLRRRAYGNFDTRYALFDSPRYLVAMACHYRLVDLAVEWQVLARVPDRCGVPRLVETLHVAPGESVAVPRPAAPGSIVYASFTLREPVFDRVMTALARPPREPRIVLDARTFRLVLGTAGQPMMLRPPAGEGYLPPGATPPETLRLSAWLGAYTVRFYEVPVSP